MAGSACKGARLLALQGQGAVTDTAQILKTVPVVPERFYGSVTFVFECGRLVHAKVEETFKPTRDADPLNQRLSAMQRNF